MFEFINKHPIKFDLIPLFILLIWNVLYFHKLYLDFDLFTLIIVVVQVIIIAMFGTRIKNELINRKKLKS